MLLVPCAAVGAVGVPVKAGLISGARSAACANTKAVVANCVVFTPGAAVGAVGVPDKDGEANGASSAACANTKAVFANCVVLVPAAAVGAVGVPVKDGEANGAVASNPAPIRSNSARIEDDVPRVWLAGMPDVWL